MQEFFFLSFHSFYFFFLVIVFVCLVPLKSISSNVNMCMSHCVYLSSHSTSNFTDLHAFSVIPTHKLSNYMGFCLFWSKRLRKVRKKTPSRQLKTDNWQKSDIFLSFFAFLFIKQQHSYATILRISWFRTHSFDDNVFYRPLMCRMEKQQRKIPK